MPHLETLILGPHPGADIPYVTNRILNLLADIAIISPRLYGQQDGLFLPKLQSLDYFGCPTFSWECVPTVFGRGTKEPDTFDTPKCNQRPLPMDLYFDGDQDQDPEVNIVKELKRLRAEKGYEIYGKSAVIKSAISCTGNPHNYRPEQQEVN